MSSEELKEHDGLNMSLDQLIEKNSSYHQKPERDWRGRGRGYFSGRRNDFDNKNGLPGRGQDLRVTVDLKHRGLARGYGHESPHLLLARLICRVVNLWLFLDRLGGLWWFLETCSCWALKQS